MGCNTSKETVPQAEQEENKTEETTESGKEKPASAKTITLESNGAALGGGEQEEASKSEAAIKIQAAFRGHQTRKSMKQPAGKVQQQEAEPTREELEQEFRPDDEELCHAATKIQASFRGHMSRKNLEQDKGEQEPSHSKKPEEEEVDIDLTDPEVNKAAVKIQASFRGHMIRKQEKDAQADN